MCGMELGQLLRIETAAGCRSPPIAPEHVCDEVSKAVVCLEPPLLGHWEIRPSFHEDPSENAGTVFGARAARSENLHSFDAATRRSAFEDEAVEACLLELGEPFAGETLHPLGQILARFRFDQPWCRVAFDEPDWRPWHAEPDLDLRTHRDPLEELTEHLGDVVVELVAAVVADLDAEQAGRGADSDRLLVVP